MVIPAPMNYYSGAAILKEMNARWREDQRKELLSANPGMIGMELNEDIIKGVELGLATARAIIAGSAELAKHGVDPNKVL